MYTAFLNAIEQGQTTPYDAFQVGFPPEREAGEEPAAKPEKGAEELDEIYGGVGPTPSR